MSRVHTDEITAEFAPETYTGVCRGPVEVVTAPEC